MVNKKLILIGALLFYSCASFSVAQDSSILDKQPDFDINGMKLGDKLTVAFFNKHCSSANIDNAEIECKQKIKLNGIKLSILYFFHNGKLIALSFNYPSSKYSDLIDVYTKKFELSPHSNTEEPILLSTGAKYTNKKVSWNTASGEFVIQQYWNNLKKGSAHLSSTEYDKYKLSKSEKFNEGIIEKIFGDIFD